MKIFPEVIALRGLLFVYCTNTASNYSNFTDTTRLSFHIADYDRSFWTVELPPMNRATCADEDHP
ncbi:YEL068C-like protein [Saccharomyces kudriavzevii IFO 1802]|uniref:YEL068C-like protein n=1 Tax=Saccharomyces kudriavzevii (strain ATCC MYA-4449 / AS 2.2408 / CBS 8840 / NBRC 1802 / NCYC 2889) TaxID=226230 RepID=J8TI14_SACK1|nr:YEL068C-like protein [Saccharomyces kudriavzevii IFO 1802]